MAKRYWTKAQRATKKRGTPSKKTKEEKSQARVAARARREREEKALARKRSLAAKKAAATRAKNRRALARAASAAAKAAETIRQDKARRALARKKAKAADRESKDKRASRPEQEKALDDLERAVREKKAIEKILATSQDRLQEGFEKTLLKKFAPELAKETAKAHRPLTTEEAEELRKRARPKLKKLFSKAVKRAERTGEISRPSHSYDEVVFRDGLKTTGSSVLVKTRRYLTEEKLEGILYKVAQAAQRLQNADPRKLWYATTAISSVGRKLYVGGTIKFKKSKNPLERLIMLESHASTGLQPSMQSMLATLRADLENMIDEGTITLVRRVQVRAFDFKTRAERLAWKERHGEEHAPEATEPKKFKSRKKTKRTKKSKRK